LSIAGVGRLFFAIGLAAFGVQQFIYGDFVPGRAPAWPPAIPGRLVWACVSGAFLIVAGAAIFSGVWARRAAIASGTMIFVWALLRQLPGLVANPHGIVLTASGKALALSGGAFAVAGFLYVGQCGLGIFMLIGGMQHFIYPDFVAALIPAWIPGHHFWTYVAGVALIAGGAGLMLPKTARLAAALTGMMLLLWVVLLHMPRAVAAADPQRRNEWTAVFEALTMSGIAFVLAGSLPSGSAFVKGSRR
jgi:uncharacterized membrane protein